MKLFEPHGFFFSVRSTDLMVGVDFRAVRSQVSMAQVLHLLGFVARVRSGAQVRGPCPLHCSGSAKSRSFSANLTKNAYQCFRCGSSGNQLDRWAAATDQTVFAAAVDLCERLHLKLPSSAVGSHPVCVYAQADGAAIEQRRGTRDSDPPCSVAHASE